MKIIPGILESSFDEIKYKANECSEFPLIQIDIVDGNFAPTSTWPYSNGSITDLSEITQPYQLDLMVENPTRWITTDAEEIIFHIPNESAITQAKALGKKVGIAILPGGDLPGEKLMKQLDIIQIMGIDNVGLQGQPFSKKTKDTLTKVKKEFPNMCIQVDGGVNNTTAPLLKEADRLVVGSYLFDGDVSENRRTLEAII